MSYEKQMELIDKMNKTEWSSVVESCKREFRKYKIKVRYDSYTEEWGIYW